MKISLITVSYNSQEVLRKFWGGVFPPDIEWIVVDNASKDDSRHVASALGARVVSLEENVGFGGANNRGADQARGDVLIFCNPDVRVDVDGVRELATRVLTEGGLWAPQLVNADGSLQENGRGVPAPWRKLRHMFWPNAREDGYLRTAQDGRVREVLWVMGAAVAMTKATFGDLSGWDDKYFIYYEDSDICLRARNLGEKTWLDGGVTWLHGWARETKNGFSLSSWRYEFRSASRFYRRHWYCVFPFGEFGRAVWRADRMTRF